jgi:citrate/tricarballylate utilization protein
MPWLEPSLAAEGARIMTICNACRYCEGYCAVFPAMERRLEFGESDLAYLANLCHNCGSCLPACQYAPPHEFAVNVPQVLARIRAATYREAALPRLFASAFERSGRFTALACAAGIALFTAATLLFATPAVALSRHGGGDFYAVISHAAMVALFSVAGIGVVAALASGVRRFGRFCGEPTARRAGAPILAAVYDALRLVNLGGGGEGCTYPGEHPSGLRRLFHHLTFYGFASCFAATAVAAFYDNVLGRRAPYPLASVPVVLGTLGGVALLIGASGLLALMGRRDPSLSDPSQTSLDAPFTGMLWLTAASGLLLLALRTTPAMGLLLAFHLGAVLGFFVTLPYGKFVHGGYRLAALIRAAIERTLPSEGLTPE